MAQPQEEIGLLLGVWQWEQFKLSAPKEDWPSATMLASTVSSKSLKAVAEKNGFVFEETLTGFKWMGNRAHELRTPDQGPGSEEWVR